MRSDVIQCSWQVPYNKAGDCAEDVALVCKTRSSLQLGKRQIKLLVLVYLTGNLLLCKKMEAGRYS